VGDCFWGTKFQGLWSQPDRHNNAQLSDALVIFYRATKYSVLETSFAKLYFGVNSIMPCLTFVWKLCYLSPEFTVTEFDMVRRSYILLFWQRHVILLPALHISCVVASYQQKPRVKLDKNIHSNHVYQIVEMH